MANTHTPGRPVNVRIELPEAIHASTRVASAAAGQPIYRYCAEVLARLHPARDWQQA